MKNICQKKKRGSPIRLGCNEEPLWLFMPFAKKQNEDGKKTAQAYCVLCLNVGFSEKRFEQSESGIVQTL